MIESVADTRLFEEVARPLLAQGLSVRFQARGASMSPAIRDGEVVEVIPTNITELQKDDIVLAKTEHGFRLHRIVLADSGEDRFITRLSPSQAVAELFARSFVPFHRHEYVDSALVFLEELVDSVPVYRYSFEPDQRAVDKIRHFND